MAKAETKIGSNRSDTLTVPKITNSRTTEVAPESELLTQAQVQERFDAAVREGVSPCLWLPPEWDELKKDRVGKKFTDNSADTGKFEEKNATDSLAERKRKGGERDKCEPKSPESLPDDETWINPFADTTHIDDTEFSQEDHNAIQGRLQDQPDVLAKLNSIVGSTSPGMKRLGRIFEWILYRATIRMEKLNQSLKDQASYEDAREDYIEFLRDLDDHEPEKGTKMGPMDIARLIAAENAETIENQSTNQVADNLESRIAARLEARFKGRAKRRAEHLARRLGKLLKNQPAARIRELVAPNLNVRDKDKTSASGYGRSIKWGCIDPVIFDGKIVGTRIVVKWNPHISSSGVAVKH